MKIFSTFVTATNKMQTELLNNVFSALADPTRRRILQEVRSGDRTVAQIANLFDISLPAVSRHLKILTAAELLYREKDGKHIRCSYNPVPCREALRWIEEQHQMWNDGFDALSQFLDDEK